MRTRSLLSLVCLTVLWCCAVSAQVSSNTAYRFRRLMAAPAACNAGDVYHDLVTHLNYQCLTANTWTVFGTGTGTVTSVSGTTNQINSTGGATPVLSISSTLIAPGTITATTSTTSPFFVSNAPGVVGIKINGTSASFPGLRNTGADLDVVLADNSNWGRANAQTFSVASTGSFQFSVNTTASSGPDTVISRQGAGVTQFGSTTNNALGSILTTNATFNGLVNACLDAGANDTYTCSTSPALSSYITGAHYLFKANTANTGAATLNLNAIGAKTIVKVAGGITTALADNDIRAGQWVDVVYDGTNLQMQSTLGNAAGGGGTTILSGVLQADFPKTNNTPANVTDMTLTLTAGHWYRVTGQFWITGSDDSGEFQFDFNGGSATSTGISGSVFVGIAGASPAVQRITALSDPFGSGSGEYSSTFDFIVQVNAGGTLIPRFREVVTDPLPSTLRKYSTIQAVDVTP